jgi:hypothetical protein
VPTITMGVSGQYCLSSGIHLWGTLCMEVRLTSEKQTKNTSVPAYESGRMRSKSSWPAVSCTTNNVNMRSQHGLEVSSRYPQTELDLVIASGQVYNVIVKDLKCVGVSAGAT